MFKLFSPICIAFHLRHLIQTIHAFHCRVANFAVSGKFVVAAVYAVQFGLVVLYSRSPQGDQCAGELPLSCLFISCAFP